ncbi:MAG: DNA polymerase IV [Candidatus Omnitrophica bacterium]|nr:DNA polymerase IV [Candidatus Omnitrophota bacterium]
MKWSRKIIHMDMDAFFASIEQRDHPEYQGKPLIVGGNPFGRGVVSTASYEARKFGVHSSMPAAQARRLCPQAVFLRPDFEKYRQVSHRIMAIFKKHTDLVENLSLDEAYLNVTHHRFGIEDPVMIAVMIKQNIFAVTKLTVSAGVAPNLFLAKIASDFKKPDGLTVIYPDQIESFLKNLPVRKIPGIGPVTESELHKLKIFTAGDLAVHSQAFLQREFGKFGLMLYQRAQGIDEREVEPESEPKQYSTEETFMEDTKDVHFLKEKLRLFTREVFYGLKESGRIGRTVVLKVKYFDFEQITRSLTLKADPQDEEIISRTACGLLEQKTLAGKKAVRLIGLGISGLHRLEETKPIPQEGDLFMGKA